MKMTNKEFYGSKLQSLSYLEFGSIDLQSGSKSVYDFQLHSKAYDWLMNARYSNDIVAYIDMNNNIQNPDKIIEIFDAEMHHPDDASLNLSKWIALELLQKSDKDISFFELGQTLLGCIEGIEFIQNFLTEYLTSTVAEPNAGTLALKDVQWIGMDISHYFNILAKIIHSSYNVHTSENFEDLPRKKSLFFAKGVTLLYAIRDADQFFKLMENSTLGLFDYSLSLGQTEERIIGTGKGVTYLNRNTFLEASNKSGGEIWVRKRTSKPIPSENRILIDAVWGKDNIVDSFIKRDQEIRSLAMNTLDPRLRPLFYQAAKDNNDWISLEEFLSDI